MRTCAGRRGRVLCLERHAFGGGAHYGFFLDDGDGFEYDE